jgi:hypothetical protein
MTGTNGVEVEDGVHENGGHIAPLKERAAKEAELLEQMRERIAVLDPGSKVSSWLGVGCSWLHIVSSAVVILRSADCE